MAKLDKTELLEYIVFENLYLKKGYRLALEVRIPSIRRRVDLIGIDKDNNIINVEIKVTKADFKSKSGHTFIGNKNYYAMTPELYELIDKEDIPKGVGVMVCEIKQYTLRNKLITTSNVKIVKPARTQHLKLTRAQLNRLKKNIETAANSNIRRLLKYRADIILNSKPNN